MRDGALSLDEIEKAFFDESADSKNRVGYVSEEFRATDAEQAAALALLTYRREQFGWRRKKLKPAEVDALLRLWARPDDPMNADATERYLRSARCTWKPLAFYRDGKLVHWPGEGLSDRALGPDGLPTARRAILYRGPDGDLIAAEIDGRSAVIHDANDRSPIDLSPQGAAEEYLQFFCEHIVGDKGAFTLAEESHDPIGQGVPEFYFTVRQLSRPAGLDPDAVRPDLRRRRVDIAQPITRIANPPDTPSGMMRFIATAFYEGAPSRSAFLLSPDGLLTMADDCSVEGAIFRRPQVPWVPEGRMRSAAQEAWPEVDAEGFVAAVKHLQRGPCQPVSVIGKCDFESWDCDRSIMFRNVMFDGEVDLSGAKLASLGFNDCTFVGNLNCAGIMLSGDLVANPCRFVPAPGSMIESDSGRGIILDDAEIGGSATIGSDGLQSYRSAVISGRLTIVGLEIRNGFRPATIRAENAEIGGDVRLGPSGHNVGAERERSEVAIMTGGGVNFAGASCADFIADDLHVATLTLDHISCRNLTLTRCTSRRDVSLKGGSCGTAYLAEIKAPGAVRLDNVKCFMLTLAVLDIGELTAQQLECQGEFGLGGSFAQPVPGGTIQIRDNLDITSAKAATVLMMGCTVGRDLTLSTMQTDLLQLSSVRAAAVWMMGADVRNMARFVGVAVTGEISCASVRIGGQFSFGENSWCRELSFNGSDIGSMLIGTCEQLDDGVVVQARIGGLYAVDSTFRSYVQFTRTVLESSDLGSVTFQNCQFLSKFAMWTPFSQVSGSDGVEYRYDGWSVDRSVTIAGSLDLIDCRISGDLDLTRLNVVERNAEPAAIRLDRTVVGGALRFSSPLSTTQRRGLSAMSRASAAEAMVQASSNPKVAGATRAVAGMLSMRDCEIGEIDLSGLNLVKPGMGGGHLDAARLTVRGTMSMYAHEADNEDRNGQAGAPRQIYVEAEVAGALRLPSARIGELRVASGSFPGGDGKRPEMDGIVLEAATIGILRVPALDDDPSPNRAVGSFPVPLDLSGLSVTHWVFSADERAEADTEATPYLDFLDNDERPQRDVYRSVAQTLRDLGQDAEAKRILFTDQYRANFAREAGENDRWFDHRGEGRLVPTLGRFGRKTGKLTPRWSLTGFGNWFYRLFLNYGLDPMPLAVVIFGLFAASLLLVAPDRRNFEPTLAGMQKVKMLPAGDADRARRELDSRWGLGDMAWVTLRYHVPVAGFDMREEYQPSTGPLYTTPARVMKAAGLPEYRIDWLNPEDWYGIMAFLNWIMWPLLLTFLLRKVLRD